MTPLTFISSEHPLWDALHPTYLNGIYFDGMTEEHFSYDCCGLLHGAITPGIFDCTIHDYPNPCKAFIWEHERTPIFWRGLVVDAQDTASIEKAKQAYNERKQFL